MRIIIATLLLAIFSSYSMDNTYEYECISLGEVCTTAAALQAFGLRKAAYPFDWTISMYQSLYDILKNDFQDFLNPNYLSIRPDNHGIINKYGLVLVHDFPTMHTSNDIENADLINEDTLHPDWINFLSDVQKKYNRRIERFRNMCMSNKKIYFIRHGGTSRDRACLLRNLLKTSYPHLNFTLVIVGHDSSFATPWKEKNIKNYYLDSTTVWNDVAQWKNIFIDLGLYNNKTPVLLFPYTKHLFHKH